MIRDLWPVLVLAALWGEDRGLAAAPARPNIILVMPDDVGYGDFACLGNPVIRTPNLDALHSQSVRFTDFHVSPTCAPTRAALLTGRHEFKSGVSHTIFERERLSLKATTLARVLKSAGYATGIFGKWHLGDEAAHQPEKRGFDEVYIHGGGGIGQTYPGSCGDAPGNLYFNPALLHNETFEKSKGYCTDLFFGQAVKWIDDRRKQDAPFFAYITPNAAHAPLQCPDVYYKRYAGKVPENTAKFYGMIENIDDNMGRLLKALAAWGIERNTLVIFMTDNGGTEGVRIFNAGMRGAKATPYQGGTRVPSFWRWPAGFQGGVDVEALTAHLDVLPTLAALAGAAMTDDLRAQVEGRSLLPVLHDPKAAWPNRTLVSHVGRWPRGRMDEAKFHLCSIRDSRFTLVNNQELYDLKADPGESKDVGAAHPDVLARLRADYDRWWESVRPCQENEDAIGPKVNPFKERYWAQFGGGPDAALREQMDPERAAATIVGKRAERPNIVYVLADDLGYGDVRALNPEGKIATPSMDRLAESGMTFTDAHSGSSVCSPTRYGLLTGRYSWRSPLKHGVLTGYSRRLIEPERLTVAGFLQQQGYATIGIGKWHLGMDWPLKEGGFAKEDADGWKVDYTRPIADGPRAVGFDSYFGISASLDMPPYVFIRDDRATVVPTVEKQWIRKGPAAESFEAIDVLPTLTREAVAAIDRRAADARAGKPFFLYLPLTAPHTPIVPTADRQGQSGLNAYGDFVTQVDETVGRVLDALDRNDLWRNTLVILTSDNGCAPLADIPALVAKGHNPSYHLRGHKADIFEGGHRMPFLARWPARVRPGSTSDQLICHTDLFATCADVLGVRHPETAAEDSVSFLAALEGRASGPSRAAVVHHSANGSFAIRQGKWKLELCPDSGGWSAPRPGSPAAKGLPAVQLYDLNSDLGETTNLQDQHPEVVARLTSVLEQYVADGRSTPGAPRSNTGAVMIRRRP